EAGSCSAVPPEVSSEDAVCTVLLGISIRGVRGGKVTLGKSVAVFGLGVIGQFATHLSKLAGGYPVIAIDPVAARREIARKMGADVTLDPFKENVAARIKELTGGKGVDVAIESTATPRVVASLPELTAFEGTLVILGGVHGKVEMDFYTYVQKSNQTIVGCGSPYHADYPFISDDANHSAILQMMKGGMVRPRPAVTHQVPYTQGPEMYRILIEEKDKAVGVQFTW
ncbi:MAG TPA: zinc-binding alcohol dehydrogenase, partial [Planctomycetota bacterium]|nr:zinc-binding alcohol dehydrogenase [Planctomycetota bacterium]